MAKKAEKTAKKAAPKKASPKKKVTPKKDVVATSVEPTVEVESKVVVEASKKAPKKAVKAAPKGLKYYEAIGRRKTAIARVRIYLSIPNNGPKGTNEKVKKGEIYVNGMPIVDYLPADIVTSEYALPLQVTDNMDRFAISILARGGGKHGQLDAIRLGLARAIEKIDEDYRKDLKPDGLLTRDPRSRERRKVGTGGRARRQKQSPKR